MKTQPNDPIAYVDELQAIEGSEDYNRFLNYGLTKREYFAAMAMQGICADTNCTHEGQIIISSVRIADLLIEELNK